jgi:hypothetical protein
MSTSWDTSDCFRFFRQTLLSSEDIALMFNTTVTLWCPTREAFDVFNNEDFNRLLEPIWVRHAQEFLLNHMSSPARTRNDFVNMAPGAIEMLNGAVYELRKSGTRPRIKNTFGSEQGRSEFGDLIALDGYVLCNKYMEQLLETEDVLLFGFFFLTTRFSLLLLQLRSHVGQCYYSNRDSYECL